MMIQPIPRHFLMQLNRVDRQVKALEAAITSELAAGNLKPGDPIASPDHLAKKWNLSPVDVLESVSRMLASGALRQNRNGELFIAEDSTAPSKAPRQQVA